MELLDYVNERDEVIGQKSRKEVYNEMLTHRIVHVFVVNDRGELAVQMRSKECGFKPLHWGMSAAGHVQAGETYELAGVRELKEELGVEVPITYLCKEHFVDQDTGLQKFISAFMARHNGPLTIDPAEIDHVVWKSITDVRTMIAAGEPCVPQFVFMFERHANGLR